MNEGHQPPCGDADAPSPPLLNVGAMGISIEPDNPVNHLWDYVGGKTTGSDASRVIGARTNTPSLRPSKPPTLPASRPPSEWMNNLQSDAAPCSGLDSHVLGMSTTRRIIAASIFATLGVLILFAGDLLRFGGYAAGFLLCAILIGGYSVRVVGDELVSRRLGVAKRVSLRDVTSIEPYTYRGCVSLRLWTRSGKRAPSISIVGRSLVDPAFRINPTIAGHLMRYLNRPDMGWGPGAWPLLESAANRGSVTAGTDQESTRGRPLGIATPKRPPTRLQRRILRVGSGCALLCMLLLVLLAPIAWSGYNLSQKIQHGPEVTAKLLSQWVSSSTDRTGTSYTTHFSVTFYVDTRHTFVTTQISARGYFSSQPAGSQIYIRYNPANPLQAELPGHPNHSFTAAVVMTGLALLVLAASPWLVPRLWRRVRRAPQMAHEGAEGTGHRLSTAVEAPG
jgi:hypothetical protein